MSVALTRVAPLLALCALCGLIVPAQAQQAPPAPAPAPAAPPPAAPAQPPALSVLVVDVQALLQNSKSAKMVRQQLEAKRAEYAKEISKQEETLRQERDRLMLDRTALEYQESKLLDPAHLEELAKMQQFIDPAPTKVVYLDGKTDQVVAEK